MTHCVTLLVNQFIYRRPTTTTAKPFTSSPSTESSKYVHLGINELLKKLRSTTVNPGDADLGKTTNGPYDSISINVELHDDPAAMMDHRVNEDYVSTIVPDAATDSPSVH